MDKSAIKKFAIEARKKLIEQVKQKAFEIGITADRIEQYEEVDGYVIVHGKARNGEFKKQREQLISAIESKGYEQVMEEMAYTWFNRFISLRFMEVNGYLPIGVRVLSSEDPTRTEPDVFREVVAVSKHLDLDLDKVFELQDQGDDEGLFKYIILKLCNVLHEVLPFMFEKINDYSELLFPNNLLIEDSVIRQMVTTIPEEDWKEVEIIGWLYQYYITELYERISGINKGTVSKEDLPFATQLFTPKWIVQYMVQNSLGKMWDDAHGAPFAKDWEYYLWKQGNSSQIPDDVSPEKIKVLDPACGSGHILVYAFDVLYDIYLSQGYSAKDIPALILRNNLFGLDIDRRAVQLASFALVMKAASKDPFFVKQHGAVQVNVYEFVDSVQLSHEVLQIIAHNEEEERELLRLLDEFENAKQFGSLSIVTKIDFDKYLKRITKVKQEDLDLMTRVSFDELKAHVLPLLRQGKMLTDRYHAVITNPPYHNKYNPELKKFINTHYNDYKGDLYSAFIYRCTQMTVKNGYAALMTPFTWMFISSHEKLRQFILQNQSISSLIQLEYSGFAEATVPICTFVIQNQKIDTMGEYVRLADFKGPDLQPVKAKEAAQNPNVSYRYSFDSTNFPSIPGSPIAYWASETVQEVFQHGTPLGEIGQPRVGLQTGNNSLFLRFWHEVDLNRIGFRMEDSEEAQMSRNKWFPYNKGGSYRKWYGNQDYLLNWENNGAEIRAFSRSVIRNPNYYFREGITWSFVSSSRFGVRYTPSGFIFDVSGSSLFPKVDRLFYILGFMCSKLGHEFLKYLNPTLSFQVGNIASLPIKIDEDQLDVVNVLAQKCIEISKHDWDIFEDSWDFQRHPLLVHKDGSSLEQAFNNWSDFAEEQFQRLKANEEELNRIFIEIYGLQDELTPEVADEDITIRRADRERDVRSFISYAVGCMFGRYSLDEDGLVYAGGEFDLGRYKSFPAVEDNILTILDDEYFDNDIVARFIDFVRVTFGPETLEDNLEFIADSLNRRASETARETIRRYFLREFYRDHTKTYKKRPIYWLFSSPNGSFNCLIYMHRYDRDTIARIRTDYLLPFQDKLSAEEMQLRQLLTTDLTAREKTAANKRLGEIDKVMNELSKYQELIHHLANKRVEIDLDDGVAVNYAKFQNVLAKIR